MKTRAILPQGCSCLFAAIVLSFDTSALAQTSGWSQTAAGPYDYDDTANWIGGTINGLWDSSLTLTSGQAATFDSNLSLTTGLNIGYTGNVDLTLRSDGTQNRTITLGGDITVNPASNRTLFIGSFSANNGLNVDLGGDRTFSVAGAKNLTFYNGILGGDLVLRGTTTASAGTVRFGRDGASAASSDITAQDKLVLEFDSSTNGNVGTTRADNITLQTGANLYIRGNNTNSTNIITGGLVTDGSRPMPSYSSGAFNTLSIHTGSAHALFQASGLVRANHGTLFIRGTNLGSGTIASKTAGSTSIELTGSSPTLVGGGGSAGTTGMSIIPWTVAGVAYNSASPTTFVTHTAANGIRPLDVTTEFAGAIGLSATDNVRLTATSDTVVSGNQTVNSLILAGSGGSISGASSSDTLTVTSGAVLMTRTTGSSSNINIHLNFGTREGIIGYVRGDVVNGAVSGSGGLTIHGGRSDENLRFTNNSSTYTGDTHILSNAMVSSGFLPGGSRTGNVHVSGNLQLDVSGYNGTINGLFGSGTVKYGNSGNSSLAIGDNDATSTFDGSILANEKLSVSKIGSGTLTMNGANEYTGPTNVTAGTLVVNGSLGNTTTTIGSNGTLKGAGSIAGATSVLGTLAPGNSIGTLGFGSSLDLLGISNFEIDPTLGLGLNADLADVTGALTYGGTLNVLYGGSSSNFANGMVFNLFDAGSFAGSFSSINLPDLTGTGLSWQDNLLSNGTLVVVPEPRAALLGGLGMLALLRRRRG